MKPYEENGPVAKRRRSCRLQKESEVEESTLEKGASKVMKIETNLADLPPEILLKIMENLSTQDILRNVAQVSKKFHQISQDRFLVKRIELKSNEEFEIWTRSKEKNYFADFFKVLKRSEKLTCLSLNLEFMGQVFQLEKIIKQLPFLVNPRHLQEFCLKSSCDFQQFKGNILKYLDKCPKLKILKIDCFKTGNMGVISKTISKFKFKNVKELHLTLRGTATTNYTSILRNVLERFIKNITQNLPNIRLLRLTISFHSDTNKYGSYNWIRRCLKKFGRQVAVKIKIRNL